MLRVVLVGHGNMGSALYHSWTQISDISVTIVSPESPAQIEPGDCWVDGPDQVQSRQDMIVFAVKPQILNEILPEYACFFEAGAVGISIAAGVTLETLNACAGVKGFIRAMPNLPIQKGFGITGMQCTSAISPQQQKHAELLFSSASKVVWCSSDNEMDQLTAVFGSGPGFIFELVSEYVQLTEEMNLQLPNTEDLVVELFRGAVALLEDARAKELCRRVASPGGTTEAGLEKFRENKSLRTLLHRAFYAAVDRATKLRS